MGTEYVNLCETDYTGEKENSSPKQICYVFASVQFFFAGRMFLLAITYMRRRAEII